jgi:hypothetical protein
LGSRRTSSKAASVTWGPSVAEQAMHFMFALAKRGVELNAI